MADVAFAARVSTNDGGTSQMVVNNPGSSGQFALLALVMKANATITAVHDGFSIISTGSIDGGGSTDPALYVYGKVLTSTESTSFRFDRSVTAGGHAMGVLTWSGHGATGIADAVGDSAETDHNAVSSLSPPDLTITKAGSARVAIAGSMQSTGAPSFSTMAGMTTGITANYGAGGFRASIGMWYSTGLTTGASTFKTVSPAKSMSCVSASIEIAASENPNPAARYHYHSGMNV